MTFGSKAAFRAARERCGISQKMLADRYGRDKGDYAIVNARSREIAAILEAQGIEAQFRYPEDDEAGFQRLANTR